MMDEMNKRMLEAEELEQVAGGNIVADALAWIRKKMDEKEQSKCDKPLQATRGG